MASIARGDSGIEKLLPSVFPVIQHELIKKCIDAHKPVIVATQMLHPIDKTIRVRPAPR